MSRAQFKVGTAGEFILRHPGLRSGVGNGRSTQDVGQNPEIAVAIEYVEVPFVSQPSCGGPSLGHGLIAPAEDLQRALADAALRALGQIGRGQSSLQRRWHVEPLQQGERVRNALAQASGRLFVIAVEETCQLNETLLTFFGRGRYSGHAQQALRVAALLFRQFVEHVPLLVLAAALDRLCAAEHFLNRCPQGIWAIDHKQIPLFGVEP